MCVYVQCQARDEEGKQKEEEEERIMAMMTRYAQVSLHSIWALAGVFYFFSPFFFFFVFFGMMRTLKELWWWWKQQFFTQLVFPFFKFSLCYSSLPLPRCGFIAQVLTAAAAAAVESKYAVREFFLLFFHRQVCHTHTRSCGPPSKLFSNS